MTPYLQPIRVAALICAGGLLSAAGLANAFTSVVTVNASSATANGVSLCQDAPTLQMDPSGNLNVVCTPANSGPPVFSCTLSPLAQSAAVGSTTTLSIRANCSNGTPPYSYAWTALDAQPLDPSTAALQSINVPGPFNTAGSYRYQLVATDSATPTAATYQVNGTINVAAVGSCATTSTNGAFTGTTGPTYTALMPPGGYLAYSLPVFTSAQVGKLITIYSVSASGSPAAINVQFSVSKCPGDFNADSACMMDGVTSTLRMNQYVGLAETPGTSKCTLQAGTQYYVNLRPVLKDHVTASCTKQSTCGAVINWSIR